MLARQTTSSKQLQGLSNAGNMYTISDKVSVIHAMTMPSELFLLASRVQVTIKQRAAMALHAHSQIIFMDTLALSEWLTCLDKAPMSFMLAIHTGGFICFQCELRTTDYREETTQAMKCSITWLTENYQHTTCWICDHATCCILLCFTLQHRITLLSCLTGASGESEQNQMCVSYLLLSDFQWKIDT